MSSDKDDFREDCDYKSCFARSMAVNSHYKLAKYLDHEKQNKSLDIITDNNNDKDNIKQIKIKKTAPNSPPKQDDNGNINAGEIKLRKDFYQHEFSTIMMRNHRLSTNLNHHHHLGEIPVENIVQQSKVDTLQWQLRETEKSRAMYKELMKQVVVFLEKAHRNLDILSTKINNSDNKKIVSRSKSEHQIVQEQDSCINKKLDDEEDYTSFRDYTWRRLKKHEPEPDEIPPERLSKEAFRLLRTAQSLLNTQEPNLVQMNNDIEDVEFLNQLAKEFPSQSNCKPQRATSFSLSPKLIVPEYETRISTAFNRKLSLQLNETRPISKNITNTTTNCSNTLGDLLAVGSRKCKNDVTDKGNLSLLSSTSTSSSSSSCSASTTSTASTGGCSINSVEDESGFSSMNSFQEVGLPKIDRNLDYCSLYGNTYENDVELWQKCDNIRQTPHRQHHHKRWSSTPIDSAKMLSSNQSMKVLWV